MVDGDSKCDSLAIRRGAIAAVGRRLEHDTEFKSYPRINLQGATVYPGFVDAHTHFYYFALSLGKANLTGCATLESALDRLTKHADTLKSDQWLLGEGLFIDETTQPGWNAAAVLDSRVGSRPIAIYTRDQHTLWANSAALKKAGITRKTIDPPAGKIERLSSGDPSGILRENSAIGLVLGCAPRISNRRENQLYAEALEIAYRQGVTGVHSFDSSHAFEFFHNKAQRNELGLRISYYVQPPNLERVQEITSGALGFGWGDEWLRIAGIKIFADGALGSRTALTHQPYNESNGNAGLEVTSPKELRKLIVLAQQYGLPSAIHAIGDRAVTNCIEALAKFPPDERYAKARHRIEHLQMIRRKDLPLLKRAGIVASMQPSHLPDDVADIQSCWGVRAKNCYIHKSLIDLGVPLAFGSDVPIVELNPLAGIRDAIRRRSSDGKTILNSPERITAHQAAMCFTRGAAYAAGEEDYSGSILPGYRADLTILSQNLRKVNLTSVADISVVATIVDGKVVYSDSSFDI